MPDWMIHTERLTKRFPCSAVDPEQGRLPLQTGDTSGQGLAWFTAVDRIDLKVPPGEIVALVGPNGAGKTTTVRMLAAILKPSEGRAWVSGFDTVHDARQVRHAVGLLTEWPGLYLRMRASEYLAFFGELQGMSADQTQRRTESLMARFGLAQAQKQRLAEYSKGMRQKLALIRAMLHDPDLLLLDEPTSAMDPHSAKQVRDAILDLRRDRRTVLICTHNLGEAELLADRIAIIRRGQIVALDSPERLKAELLGPALLEVRLADCLDGYLGELSDLIQLEEWGDRWFRYRASRPQDTNPALLARLAGLGARVVALSEIPRSLEDVYLRIVEEDDGN